MVVSEAKREANRRNARLSTGPRSASGKSRSSLNATKHGLRAETLILFDEDPQVLEDRRAAWRGCLLPGDDVEERLVDDAVVYTWQQDRARRAQAKRINANITHCGVDQGQTNEKEVEDLGRRLFTDRMGPLPFYPTGSDYDEGEWERNPSTSFAGNGKDDPDRPSVLVLSLLSTLLGCEWMLGEWAKLKAILDKGQPWVSSDKLKAVRLLGKQPFDAIDENDVALVFLASFVLKGGKGRWYWEILMEMNDNDTTRFRRNAADRQLESLKPADAAQARQALLAIIERATDRLTARAEAHRERARVMAELLPDILAFDDTPAGERLRRFDLASGRGLARSLAELRKHRSSTVVSGPLSVSSSVVSGPLSVVNCEVDAVLESESTNEATSGQLSVVSCPLPFASFTAHAVFQSETTNEATDVHENAIGEPTVARENATNEPTVVRENAPNEPTIGQLSVVSCPLPVACCTACTVFESETTNEPTVAVENLANEPTAVLEIVTNEPNNGQWSVVSCLLPVVSCNVEAVDAANAPNEATDAVETLTNEPTVAHEIVTNEPNNGQWSVASCPLPVASCTAQAVFEEGFSVQESESILKACEKIRLARTEQVRKLNEEARREAEAAMVIRRFRLGEQKNKNGQPAGQRKARATQPGQTSQKETAAPSLTELEQFVKTALAQSEEAHPPFD